MKVIITSLYLSFDPPTPTTDLVQLFLYSQETNLPIIISFNANAHKITWSKTETNARGTSPLG